MPFELRIYNTHSDHIISCIHVAVIQCPPLQPIANGFITYSPDNTPDYDIGTLATYTCDEGFAFASALTIQLRNCNDDDGMDAIGVWGGSAPTCVRK